MNEVSKVAPLARVEQRQDIRMLERRRDADLAQEPLGSESDAYRGIDNLDRHAPAVLEIVRGVHGRHPATAEHAIRAIAPGERRRSPTIERRRFGMRYGPVVGRHAWPGNESPTGFGGPLAR